MLLDTEITRQSRDCIATWTSTDHLEASLATRPAVSGKALQQKVDAFMLHFVSADESEHRKHCR